jgi:hypothetical protein
MYYYSLLGSKWPEWQYDGVVRGMALGNKEPMSIDKNGRSCAQKPLSWMPNMSFIIVHAAEYSVPHFGQLVEAKPPPEGVLAQKAP